MSAEDSLDFHHLTTIESTQDFVLARLDSSEKPWVLALADHQSRGRGTRARAWSQTEDVSAQLLLSLGTTIVGANENRAHGLALAAGESLWNALQSMRIDTSDLFLKWPNDLMLSHTDGNWKKAGGILCELKRNKLVVGIGLNLRSAPQAVPTATSLEAFLPADAARDFRPELALGFFHEFKEAYKNWLNNPSLYMEALSQRLNEGLMKKLQGARIQIKATGEVARVLKLDSEGFLRVLNEGSGPVERVVRSSEEIQFFQFLPV